VIQLSPSLIAPGISLAIGLLAGLAAAYGRELKRGRRPGWRWWISMLLLLPAAAITSEALTDAFALTLKVSTLLAMLTILRGYDGLTLIQKRCLLPVSHPIVGSRLQPETPMDRVALSKMVAVNGESAVSAPSAQRQAKTPED
jgi:hypothetical protein